MLRARPHRNVFRQIDSANRAVGINEKFSWARDVRAFRPGARVQNIVSTNNLRSLIGQQRKRVPEFSRLPPVNLRRIDADADNANAACVEFRKPFLETPQLGVAERSPKPTIENQHDSSRAGEQIPKANRFSILIQ